MEATVHLRRTLLAGAAVAAPVVLAAANALFPKDTFQYAGSAEKATAALAATAASPGRVFAASLVSLVGIVLLAATFCAAASLVRRRGGATATAGTVFGVIGCVGGLLVVAWLGLSVYAASKADIAQDAKVGYLVSLLKDTKLGNIVGMPFFGGLLLGSVLMGIALFRSGQVSRWLAAAFPVAVIMAELFAPQGPPALLTGLPLLVVGVLLARHIVTDDSSRGVPAADAPEYAHAAS